MNSEIPSDIQYLANKIYHFCENEKITTNYEFCIYLAGLKLLPCREKLTGSVVKDMNHLEILTVNCTSAIKEETIWMKTLKLQFSWKKKSICKAEIKKTHHESIFRKVYPIMMDIVEENRSNDVDKNVIHRKIAIFIIIFTGLGNPAHQLNVKDTQAALYSIFKNSEIDSFLSLPKSTKEQHLIELSRLVTGIKLFNKDCKKGGEEIEDLPLVLSQEVQATKERVLAFKDNIDKTMEDLTKVLVYVYDLNTTSAEEIKPQISNDYRKENVNEFKDILVYFRQTELYLKIIIKEIDDCSLVTQDLMERLQRILLRIHEVVRYRVAIFTDQVFPLFLQLSDVWVGMQEEADVLKEINNLFIDISGKAKTVKPINIEKILKLNLEIESDYFAQVDVIKDKPSEFFKGVTLCTFSSVSKDNNLQYQGYCAWTLAYTRGTLVSGNVAIGILSFENRFYSFSSSKAAHKWAANPPYYIKLVLDITKLKTELINLLNLSMDLEIVHDEEKGFEEKESKKKENVEVQTDLHPIESYHSREYTFSEWEIRKRALKLASLLRCRTKSQQTLEKSVFKKNVGIQVKPSK